MNTKILREVDVEALDAEAFKFRHALLDHPALTLDNLGKLLPALPKEQVRYAMRRLANGDDFEQSFDKKSDDPSIEETIEKIRHSDSYVMVRSPETHPSFREIYRELIADVEGVMQAKGVGAHAISPMLFLFIASPNSITPFHIDRYSTFLMQFRGSKEVTVYPQWDRRIVSAPACEAYMAYASTKLAWTENHGQAGTTFDFHPGDALHIPFAAGHYVRNGGEDVSISMSIIFNTEQSRRWRAALEWNHWMRRFGLKPAPVPSTDRRDALKCLAQRTTNKVARLAHLR